MIAAVVLAAGLSRRMGRPKLLLPLGGRPVIRITVDRVAGAGLDDIVVVVGPEPEAMARALEGSGARLVVNPAPGAGQASSIVAGISALRPGTRAAVIVLGDQPGLPPEILPRLVETFSLTGRPVVAPRYLDGAGTPVLFAASVFPELAALTGDRGARGVLERVPERVAWVPLDIPRPADLDTPEDWERLARAGGVH